MSTLSPPRRTRLLAEMARRGAWLCVQLVLVSLFVFATLGRSNVERELPLFINTRPKHVATETWRLAQAVGQDGVTNPDASKALVDLGGAALPHLLPKLDSLQPEARQAVLQALGPLAERMQLGPAPTSAAASEALWTSFWNDHFVDFHPAMARRVVRRFVQGPTPQRALEVRRLDTFALAELVQELARSTRERADRATIEQIVDLLCSITRDGDAPCESRAATTNRAMFEAWREWWLRRRHRFETPNGAERLLAPVLQTEYAVWVRSSTRLLLTGRALSDVPWRDGLLTSWQLGLGLFVTWLTPRMLSPLDKRLRPSRLACLAIATSLPWLLWVALGSRSGWLSFGGIGAGVGLGLGLWNHVYSQATRGEVGSRLGTYVFSSNLFGMILAVESVAGARGLGPTLVAAVERGNLRATIGAAVSCALALAFCNAVSFCVEVFASRLDHSEDVA